MWKYRRYTNGDGLDESRPHIKYPDNMHSTFFMDNYLYGSGGVDRSLDMH